MITTSFLTVTLYVQIRLVYKQRDETKAVQEQNGKLGWDKSQLQLALF